MRHVLILLALFLTGKATGNLESVANFMRARVIQIGDTRTPLPSQARDLSVEVPRGARKVGKNHQNSKSLTLPLVF